MTGSNEVPRPSSGEADALERAKAAMAPLLDALPRPEPWADRLSPAHRPLPPA